MRVWVQSWWFRVQGLGFGVWSLELRVHGELRRRISAFGVGDLGAEGGV